MTLDEAVAVLNRHKHQSYMAWGIGSILEVSFAIGPYRWMSAKEAIAIAEKYERADAV